MSKRIQLKSLVIAAAGLYVAEAQALATEQVATTGKYIVVFEQDLPEKKITELLATTPEARIEKMWDGGINAALIGGITAEVADRLRKHTGVLSAEPERLLPADQAEPVEAEKLAAQKSDGETFCNPLLSWCQYTPANLKNLDRIDHRFPLLDERYTYNYTGQGVVIYIVDSGVEITHSEFADPANPGVVRASHFFNAFPLEPHADQSGHGTHVASIAAGTTYGVAKRALIRSVRVCHDVYPVGSDICPESAILDGLQYISDNTTVGSGPRVVVNLSIKLRGASYAIASKINYLAGVKAAFVVSASGNAGISNRGDDVCTPDNPALVAAGNHVVGSVDGHDVRYFRSNWGSCVFLHAPGVAIVGAKTGTAGTGSEGRTGTSQAAPHVSGAAALILEEVPTYNVLQVQDELVARAAGAAFLPSFWSDPSNTDTNHVTPPRVLCTRNQCKSE